ncbi:MAG: GDP-mannose 4,6-dehydratase [Coprobacillus sp.]
MENEIGSILILGAAGFVGGYLIKECKKQGYEVYATKLEHEEIHIACDQIYNLNLLDKENIHDVLHTAKPKSIVNLSAQSSVGLSWKNPQLTIDVNIKGVVNLLESVKEYDKNTKILLISSSEEYGKQSESECYITEEHPTNPSNPYAVTKACQTMFSKLYNESYDMNIITMRAFNHIGPGQNMGFVVPDFCQQIVDIEIGKKAPKIIVGNLSACRDFTDVRDIVKGYLKVLEKGKRNTIYNIGSGKAVSIESILKQLLSFSRKTIEIEIDSEKFRPNDVKIIEANIDKIRNDTGYQPEISLSSTLQETLNYFRKKSEENCEIQNKF